MVRIFDNDLNHKFNFSDKEDNIIKNGTHIPVEYMPSVSSIATFDTINSIIANDYKMIYH